LPHPALLCCDENNFQMRGTVATAARKTIPKATAVCQSDAIAAQSNQFAMSMGIKFNTLSMKKAATLPI